MIIGFFAQPRLYHVCLPRLSCMSVTSWLVASLLIKKFLRLLARSVALNQSRITCNKAILVASKRAWHGVWDVCVTKHCIHVRTGLRLH